MKFKDQLYLEEAYTNIVKENLKTYEVWLDRPGNSWKEIVKAKTPEQAKRIASKTHSSEMNGAQVREVSPQNTQSGVSEPTSDTESSTAVSGIDPETTQMYYSALKKFENGEITSQQWYDICAKLLGDLMEKNKDVFVRLKHR